MLKISILLILATSSFAAVTLPLSPRMTTFCQPGYFWNSAEGLCNTCPLQNGIPTTCRSASSIIGFYCAAETFTDSYGNLVPKVYDSEIKKCVSQYCQGFATGSTTEYVCSECIIQNGAQMCTECITGYVLMGNVCIPQANNNCKLPLQTTTQVCTQCNLGYYLTTNYYTVFSVSSPCQPCGITGCQICPTKYTCTECSSLQYFSVVNQQCESVKLSNGTIDPASPCNEANCISCVNQAPSQCYTCYSGYLITSTKTCQNCNVKDNQCLLCNPSTTATSGQVCTQCSSTYQPNSEGTCQPKAANCIKSGFASDNKTPSCTECENGFFRTEATKGVFQCNACLTQNSMYLCSTKYDNETLTSSITQVPTQCVANYQLVSKTSTENVCQVLPTNCIYMSLQSPYNCQKCAEGTYISINQTTQITSCVSCQANCISCTATSCSKCKSGTYITSTGCEACGSQTITCSSPKVSITCNPNYTLAPSTGSEMQCVPATGKLSGCEQAVDSTQSTCKKCFAGYTLYENTCVKITQSGCTQYDSVLSTCLSCQEGYIQAGTQGCVPALEYGCLYFKTTTFTSTCQTCAYKYENVKGQCVLCTDLTTYLCRENESSVTPTPTPSSSTSPSGIKIFGIAIAMVMVLF